MCPTSGTGGGSVSSETAASSKTPALKQAEKKAVVLPSASLGEAQFQTFPGLHWIP